MPSAGGRPRQRRVLVVVDLVESVRLMRQHEDDVIERWLGFVRIVREEILPQRAGRLVKSLGDGLLIEFVQVSDAVAACLEMQRRMQPFNRHRTVEQAMHLRIGAHAADVVIDELDVFGSGVNLTARLASLAAPGGVVVSDELRDAVVSGLDADIEDLGPCFMKHIEHPVRVWKLAAADSVVQQSPAELDFRTAIAVMPLSTLGAEAGDVPIADVFADDLFQALSGHPQCRVISRLSTDRLRNRAFAASELGALLGARYVVSGQIAPSGRCREVRLQVHDAASNDMIWETQHRLDPATLLVAEPRLGQRVAQEIQAAVHGLELQRFEDAPFAHLEGYSMLLGCISHMHRMSREHFERARLGLDHLVERFPRAAQPYAWIAKRLSLCSAQGWSANPARDLQEAKSAVARSLDLHPDNVLALALKGQIALFSEDDRRTGLQSLRHAIAQGPNEPLAWLYFGHALANEGDVQGSREAVDRANRLAPLDPTRYLFDSMTSYVWVAAGDYEKARKAANASIKANRQHLSSYPTLIVAEMLTGHVDDARRHARAFLAMHPAMSIRALAAKHRGSKALVDVTVQALTEAGLPA